MKVCPRAVPGPPTGPPKVTASSSARVTTEPFCTWWCMHCELCGRTRTKQETRNKKQRNKKQATSNPKEGFTVTSQWVSPNLLLVPTFRLLTNTPVLEWSVRLHCVRVMCRTQCNRLAAGECASTTLQDACLPMVTTVVVVAYGEGKTRVDTGKGPANLSRTTLL